jgi:hypothetical protein
MKKKRCRHCRALFLPDARNHDRQKYCSRPECQAKSKATSQGRWKNKPENRDYFKGPEQVERVREWRKKTPGYWKRSKRVIALQDSLTVQPDEIIDDNAQITNRALQDLLMLQHPVIIGLISNFIGSALQDDIALTLLRMQQSGQDILRPQQIIRGGKSDCKNPDFKQPYPQSPQGLLLDRSPAYPGPAY